MSPGRKRSPQIDGITRKLVQGKASEKITADQKYRRVFEPVSELNWRIINTSESSSRFFCMYTSIDGQDADLVF